MSAWILLGLFILLGYTVEAVAGFGGTVIALSLGALVLPIPVLLPVLVPLTLFMTTYLMVSHWRDIHWPTLLRLILPLMAVGTLVGLVLRPKLSAEVLKPLYGVLIVGFAGRELWRLWRRSQAPSRHPPMLTSGLMLVAGVIHGLFASAGPMLVYALAGPELNKAQLRSTLITVWVTLNGLLTLVFLADGSLLPALPRLPAYLPSVVVGVVVGEWLHQRIDERRFRQLVFTLLAVTGVVLVLSVR